MNKLVGNAVAQATDAFSINGQAANRVELDFNTNEIIVYNNNVEVTRVGVATFWYDISLNILDGVECNVKVKLPR